MAHVAHAEQQSKLAKDLMKPRPFGEKPPPRNVPFQKTKAEEQRLAELGFKLSKLLPPCASFYISPKNAQEHFVLTAKV